MFLFNQNTKNKQSLDNNSVLKILSKWKTLNRKFALYLQHKSDLLSMQAKKYALIFFCLLFGGSSIAIIIHSALSQETRFKPTKIAVSQHINQTADVIIKQDSIITTAEYERIMQFKKSLFGLRTDSSGIKKFDSIMQMRPQLLDSIDRFEKLYLSQK